MSIVKLVLRATLLTLLVALTADAFVVSRVTAATVNVSVTAAVASSAQLSVSAVNIDFGEVTPDIIRYGTPTGGSASEIPGHTVTLSSNATDGVNLTLAGPTLSLESENIDPIGAVAAPLTAGIEEYGLRLANVSGPGPIATPFNGSGYAFSPSELQTLVSTSAPLETTTYAVYYGAAVSTFTIPGTYQANQLYSATSAF